MNYIS